MFATAEYDAYAAAQKNADNLFHLEQFDEEWAEEAQKAQNKANRLFEEYEYAAGFKVIETE